MEYPTGIAMSLDPQMNNHVCDDPSVMITLFSVSCLALSECHSLRTSKQHLHLEDIYQKTSGTMADDLNFF